MLEASRDRPRRRITVGATQYGGMKADDVKRLKELEAENQKLKRIVADQALDIQRRSRRLVGGKLLSPQRRRRRAVLMRCRNGSVSLSVGRAGYAGQHTIDPTARARLDVAQDDVALRAAARRRSRGSRPRWGYRRKHTSTCLTRAGTINRKRAQRLWREEGLRVPAKRRKRQRRGESTVPWRSAPR